MSRLEKLMAGVEALQLNADERRFFEACTGSEPRAVEIPPCVSAKRLDAILKAASLISRTLADERAALLSSDPGVAKATLLAPESRKDDDGKLPLHLLPTDALEAITEILDFGQKKYAPRNWEKGMSWSRVYRATLGHLFKWWAGVPADAETGKSHLWHAGCCILFLITYELRGAGDDDRPAPV